MLVLEGWSVSGSPPSSLPASEHEPRLRLRLRSRLPLMCQPVPLFLPGGVGSYFNTGHLSARFPERSLPRTIDPRSASVVRPLRLSGQNLWSCLGQAACLRFG